MRRTSLFLFVSLLVPAVVFAIDTTDSTGRYTDAGSFSTADKAAISVLTNVGAIEGNPDGTFAAARTLNRAEFLKIALLSGGNTTATMGEAGNCFPDVSADAWYSQYICYAKTQGIVAGNPDGLFHPERAVNYAEALKMLAITFGYTLPAQAEGEAWYTRYMAAASEHEVLLTESVDPATFITRGQMARLSAAFLADSQGELSAYRSAEQGEQIESSSSSEASSGSGSSVSSQSGTGSVISSSSSSVESSSSSVNTSQRQRYPAISRQILLGQESLPFADGIIHPATSGDVRIVTLNFRQEVDSFQSLSLVDGDGHHIADLVRGKQDTSDHKYRVWEAILPAGTLHLDGDKDAILAFTAQTNSRAAGGVTNELIEPVSFSIVMQDDTTGASQQLFPTSAHLPSSQTVQALLTSIQSGLPQTGELTAGRRLHVASFQFAGTVLDGADLAVTQLELAIENNGLTLSNWYATTTDRPDQITCSVSPSAPTVVACDGIGADAGHVGTGIRTIDIYADVAVNTGASSPTLRVSLGNPGTIGTAGAVVWRDGVGNYNWLDVPGPMVLQGTLWQVH